ncbi:MAG: SIMPL domain-containing protein [Flavobacteriales bacterium]
MKQLIVILGFLLLIGCQNTPTTNPSKFKTIMIKSSGEVEVLPDMATFHIDLNCLDKSIKSSKKCLVDKSNELNSKLQSYGINKDDILTTSVDMNKSYTWQNNSRVFEGYRSSTTVFITVKNIEKLEEIYTELLENRNLDLGGLSYSHSKIDSLKNEAYVNALEKSRGLADKLLEKLPETKKEILKIGNIKISATIPNTNEYANENDVDGISGAGFVVAKRDNKSIAISKGTIRVDATLFTEYQIK